MKVLLLTAVLSVALSASSGPTPQELSEWELYKVEHMKEYTTEAEDINRRNIFLNNLKNVRQHNLKYERGEVSHSEGINAFSDKTPEEMARILNCRKSSNGLSQGNTTYEYTYSEVPKSVDWRAKGAVTGVKNQLDCGSCWAFATTGSLEGMTFLKTNKLVSLSEQMLLDCDKKDYACDGGNLDTAYTFIEQNGGIDTEASYPYEAVKGDCRFDPKNVGATVKNYTTIPKGDEDQLKQVVATKGPTSVAVAAGNWPSYKSGIFKDCAKGDTLDHAVLAVGYGTTNKGEDYWLIKNSWGIGWGMSGYIMLARGKNMCGVADDAVYPLV